MRWVQWLEEEQRHLVWMRAKRYDWHTIGRRFAVTETRQPGVEEGHATGHRQAQQCESTHARKLA